MIDVLWLEDKADELEAFNDLAYENGINLIIHETAFDAEKAITLHPEWFDAAILDARGFSRTKTEQQSTSGMHNVMFLLKSKQIPFAIFSGEVGIISNEEFINSLGGARLFKKGSDDLSVLKYIKEVVADLPNVKVKQDHAQAFLIFSNSKILDLFDDDEIYEFQKILIKLILNKDDMDVVAKSVRALFESFLFKLFDNYRWFDIKYNERGGVNFNGTAYLFENKDTTYVGKDYMGKLLSMTALYSQPLNHGEANSVKYLLESKNQYYLSCIVDSMLAIMAWLPEFIKKNK